MFLIRLCIKFISQHQCRFSKIVEQKNMKVYVDCLFSLNAQELNNAETCKQDHVTRCYLFKQSLKHQRRGRFVSFVYAL